MPHRNVANNRTGLWDLQEGDGSSRDSEEAQVDPDPRAERPAVLLLQTSR